MDVQGLAALGTKLAMGIAGNAKESFVVTIGRGAGYNAATDRIGAGGTDYPVQGVPYRRKNRQAAKDDVSGNTTTLAIEAAQFPPGTVITEQDKVTREGSGVWQIVDVENAAGALWILDIRQ